MACILSVLQHCIELQVALVRAGMCAASACLLLLIQLNTNMSYLCMHREGYGEGSAALTSLVRPLCLCVLLALCEALMKHIQAAALGQIAPPQPLRSVDQ